jgi:hypothetical protein
MPIISIMVPHKYSAKIHQPVTQQERNPIEPKGNTWVIAGTQRHGYSFEGRTF